ncbi:MAG: hypothetical protein HYY51_04645 [Candidatus Magasanikbacteria bacterium]|nr:hypothetical protein [Candidatus Magasanikbacteria bacterium]
MELQTLLKKQISLTEWLEQIGHAKSGEMRQEDNTKRARMETLASVIPFPFDKPTIFPAQDVFRGSAECLAYIQEHGNDLCALRLVPRDQRLPKLRMRGFTVHEVFKGWFKEQKIDHSLYDAHFIPHPSDHLWSSISVLNEQGFFGEIIADSHEKLTQGFYENPKPIEFHFDFKDWRLSEKNEAALAELKKIISFLEVSDTELQKKIKKVLETSFVKNYIQGYFETTTSSQYGLWFIDYNRILPALYSHKSLIPSKNTETHEKLSGRTGSPGMTRGRARIIAPNEIAEAQLSKDEILICDMTSPEYVPLMKQCAGIITDRGGILTHAAIISRELGKPCLVGTGTASKQLKNGQNIELNASLGYARML